MERWKGSPYSEKYISLHGLSNNEVRTAAKEYTIFGRVTPEQKLLLIKEFKNIDLYADIGELTTKQIVNSTFFY
mgnify:CR=1 FL=1